MGLSYDGNAKMTRLEDVPDGLSKKKLAKKSVAKAVEENVVSEVETATELFDEAFQSMHKHGKISIDAHDVISLPQEKLAEKKRGRGGDQPEGGANGSSHHKKVKAESVDKSNWPKELWKNGEQLWRENGFDAEYLRSNPENITRLFCGNLSKTITEEQLKGFIEGITYIKWITDKETKQFYGSTFIEVRDPKFAIEAVMKDKQKFMGRPLKIYYCPPRPGDVWPPKESKGVSSQKPVNREKTPKPPGCKKLYAGNLSYCIDDEAVIDFFKDCGTLVGLRWLTRQGTEEFRGCAFVEFGSTEEAEKAFLLDGKELLGRPIRLDWTE